MAWTQNGTVSWGRIVAGLIGLGLIAATAMLRSPGWEKGTLRGYAAQFHAELMRREDLVLAGRMQLDALWKAHLRTVDQALKQHDISTAVRAVHDASGAAVADRNWEGMIAVGDAFVRIGAVAGTPNASRANAHQAYLTALIRARRDGSVDGVLRTAEAFAALGDRAVAKQCLRIAEVLAGNDQGQQSRVRGVEQDIAGSSVIAVF